jgi:hypothetical protein
MGWMGGMVGWGGGWGDCSLAFAIFLDSVALTVPEMQPKCQYDYMLHALVFSPRFDSRRVGVDRRIAQSIGTTAHHPRPSPSCIVTITHIRSSDMNVFMRARGTLNLQVDRLSLYEHCVVM